MTITLTAIIALDISKDCVPVVCIGRAGYGSIMDKISCRSMPDLWMGLLLGLVIGRILSLWFDR